MLFLVSQRKWQPSETPVTTLDPSWLQEPWDTARVLVACQTENSLRSAVS